MTAVVVVCIPLGFSVRGYRINPSTPKDPYSGCTAPVTSKRSILYIYSTNIGTEYFKHGIYSPFFSLQSAVCFIILMYLVPVLFTLNIQGVLKFKNYSGAERSSIWAHSQNCEKRLPNSSCLSVRMEKIVSHWTYFKEICYLCIFKKSVKNSSIIKI